MPSFKAREGVQLSGADITELIAPLGDKYAWFLEKGYVPHYWQTLFHTMRNDQSLCRFRHLVAGRRGGKTLAAAWETLYYLLHPEAFYRDAPSNPLKAKGPLLAWVLTRDYPAGQPALFTFRECLKQAGLEQGVDYKEHKTNRWFEFPNGSFLAFKTADQPDSLRGAGLNLLWLDEAAFISTSDAYDIVEPGLGDKLGSVICTTTPSGKNWYYDKFWNDEAQADGDIGRVEYWSIDNPYFHKGEWERFKRSYHPLLFKQEFCAAFDSMAGKELAGDWLRYYTMAELPRRQDLNFFIGVDPAISLADDADRFALAVVGVTKNNEQAYLVDLFAGRLPFADQLEKIAEYNTMFLPQMIAVEANAYQAALAQQALRIPGFLPIAQMLARGKKSERILSMAPVFRTGRIRIRADQRDFINEWLDYDSTLKNPKDDTLDAVEIALRAAGALLPGNPELQEQVWENMEVTRSSLQELAWKRQTKERPADEHLGLDW